MLQPAKTQATNAKRKTENIHGMLIATDECRDSFWPAPLIMTVNDYRSTKIQGLKNATIKNADSDDGKVKNDKLKLIEVIFMENVNYKDIEKRLKQITEKEGITCEAGSLQLISNCANGDVRRGVMLLQEACRGHTGKLTMDRTKDTCMWFSKSNIGANYINTVKKKQDMLRKSSLKALFDKNPSLVNDKHLTLEQSYEQELELNIPDIQTQELMSKLVRDKLPLSKIHGYMLKYNDDFTERMIRCTIDYYVEENFKNARHPFLGPLRIPTKPITISNTIDPSRDINNNNSNVEPKTIKLRFKKPEVTDNNTDSLPWSFQVKKLEPRNIAYNPLRSPTNAEEKKAIKLKLHATDVLAAIAESRSCADIMSSAGAWKKGELNEYYIYQSRTIPVYLGKMPETNTYNSINKEVWARTMVLQVCQVT